MTMLNFYVFFFMLFLWPLMCFDLLNRQRRGTQLIFMVKDPILFISFTLLIGILSSHTLLLRITIKNRTWGCLISKRWCLPCFEMLTRTYPKRYDTLFSLFLSSFYMKTLAFYLKTLAMSLEKFPATFRKMREFARNLVRNNIESQ